MCKHLEESYPNDQVYKHICTLIDNKLGAHFRYTIEYFMLQITGSYVNLGFALLNNPFLVYRALVDMVKFHDTAMLILEIIFRRLLEDTDLQINIDELTLSIRNNENIAPNISHKLMRSAFLKHSS